MLINMYLIAINHSPIFDFMLMLKKIILIHLFFLNHSLKMDEFDMKSPPFVVFYFFFI
jgi:hypothetical protein